MHGEALNYLDELKRQREREVSFSELLQKDLDALYLYDDYELAEKFTVLGKQVSVRDELISEALKKLLKKKREIILMLYFLDMTEKEIAACLKLVQSTVHYHKNDSLRLLRKLMEWIYIWNQKDTENRWNLKLSKRLSKVMQKAINQILCYFQPFILNVRENTWMNLEEPII